MNLGARPILRRYLKPRRELRVAKKNSWRKQSCSVFSKKQSPQYLAFCCCSRARQSFVSNHWQAPLQQTMHDLDRSLRSLMTDAFDLWSRSCTVIAFNAARALGSAIPSTEVELWRITYLISILTSFGGPISVPVFECFFIPGTCYTGKQCNTACRSTPRMLSELLFENGECVHMCSNEVTPKPLLCVDMRGVLHTFKLSNGRLRGQIMFQCLTMAPQRGEILSCLSSCNHLTPSSSSE
eukprot:s5132_g2.t1